MTEDYENEYQTNKKKKNFTFTKVILVAGICFASGFAGGYVEDLVFPEEVVIQTNTPTDNGVTVTNTASSELSLQDVIANEIDTVVEILSTVEYKDNFFNQSYSSESAGSGVIISNDGYIVTNYHVIENSTEIQVTLSDGTVKEATIIGTDSKTDLAVLKIAGDNYDFAIFGDSDNIEVGDTAIAIGNPLGSLGGTVTTGIISALNREITIDNETLNLLQTNAEINPGNSGGGLFSSDGLLIGIVNAKSSATDVEGIGFAIPSNEVKEVVSQLIDDGYVSDRATIGVYVSEVSEDTLEYPAGLYITGFTEGSIADDAGLQEYDRIIAIDDIEISGYNDLSNALKKYEPNDTVTITVIRDKETVEIKMILSEASNNN